MSKFVQEHLDVLKNIEHNKQGAVGTSVRNWILDIVPNKAYNTFNIDSIPNAKISREDIFEMSRNRDTGDLEVALCVLAWGGMRRDHGRRLLQTKTHWLPIVEAMRAGDFKSRSDAYKEFMRVRKEGYLKGMGPAFFTKLICFLNREAKAFIMDQWTGKSINLLLGKDLVHLNRLGLVTDDNDEMIYDQFCHQIEKLSEILGLSPLETEERIFSEGRGKGEWRNYLIENYQSF